MGCPTETPASSSQRCPFGISTGCCARWSTCRAEVPKAIPANQPWHNSAIRADGSLRPDYMARLEKIIDRADELGMVIMLGIFYFGQDQRLEDDEAVKRAVVNTVDWIVQRGYTNVLVEIANECDNGSYDRDIIKADRVHELIELAQQRAAELGHPLARQRQLQRRFDPAPERRRHRRLHPPARQRRPGPAAYGRDDPNRSRNGRVHPKPIVNNEDDRPWLDAHQGWGHEGNNFVACVRMMPRGAISISGSRAKVSTKDSRASR
jgi:hypothetical protein